MHYWGSWIGYEQAEHQNRSAGSQGSRVAGARCARRVAVLSSGLPLRHVARQRRAGLGRGRQPLFGFCRRHRRVQHRPQPSGRGSSHQGCRRSVFTYFVRLLARRPNQAGGAAQRTVAHEGAGHELLRTVGHRERGSRVEIGALCDGTRPVHRFSGRLPRQNHGLAVVHVQQVHAAEGFLSEHARRHSCALSQQLSAAVRGDGSGACGAAVYRGRSVRAQCARCRGGGDSHRADSGRGRLPRAAGWIFTGPARAMRSAWDSADIR